MSNILFYIEQIFKSNLNDSEISHNPLTKAINHLLFSTFCNSNYKYYKIERIFAIRGSDRDLQQRSRFNRDIKPNFDTNSNRIYV